jgi:hypothetical protein
MKKKITANQLKRIIEEELQNEQYGLNLPRPPRRALARPRRGTTPVELGRAAAVAGEEAPLNLTRPLEEPEALSTTQKLINQFLKLLGSRFGPQFISKVDDPGEFLIFFKGLVDLLKKYNPVDFTTSEWRSAMTQLRNEVIPDMIKTLSTPEWDTALHDPTKPPADWRKAPAAKELPLAAKE